MSLRQRIIPSAELPFPALASIARRQVLSRKLQTDSHAIRKRYNARVGNRGRHEFAWMNPCEKMQPIIQKNQTQMLSDLFQDDSEHPSCETIICLLTRRVE